MYRDVTKNIIMLKNIGIKIEDRIIGLDILRSIAIISVIYNHGWIYSQNIIDRKVYDWFHFDGVTLFFVLSGFLIGGILFKIIDKKGLTFSNLKEFWIRRWFRTLPLYYLILTFVFVYEGRSTLFHNYKYIFFLQNLFSFKTTFFSESWSLAVEEWFYLLIPLIIFLFINLTKLKTDKIIKSVILFFLVFCIIFRSYKFNINSVDLTNDSLNDRFPFTVLGRLDSIMFGILAAYIFRYFRNLWDSQKYQFLYIAIPLLIIDYVLFNHAVFLSSDSLLLKFYRHVLHYSLLPFLVSLLLPYFYGIKNINFVTKGLVFISFISYSLYLVHLQIVAKLKLPDYIVSKLSLGDTSGGFLKYLLFWILSIFISSILYTYFEKPFTNLREYFSTKE
ncbi:MAG: hypothetical protein DI529_10760 [Chryseobacterium sp.]|nr:MAG: hypothetical protein DI529_10760 [Chryseobacterium sp.]